MANQEAEAIPNGVLGIVALIVEEATPGFLTGIRDCYSLEVMVTEHFHTLTGHQMLSLYFFAFTRRIRLYVSQFIYDRLDGPSRDTLHNLYNFADVLQRADVNRLVLVVMIGYIAATHYFHGEDFLHAAIHPDNLIFSELVSASDPQSESLRHFRAVDSDRQGLAYDFSPLPLFSHVALI